MKPREPSIESSKVAFSYGLGLAAKTTSIEYSMCTCLAVFEKLPTQLMFDKRISSFKHDFRRYPKHLNGRLLAIHMRMMKCPEDTPAF